MSDESLARAFSLVPGVRSYVALPAHERFVCEVIQAVRDGEGLTVVTGAAGTGKTLLGMVVVDRLSNDSDEIHSSDSVAADPDNFAQESAVDLDSTGFEAEQDRPGRFLAVSLQTSGLTTRRSMLQAILHSLGEPFTGLSEQESRLRVLDAGRAAIQSGQPIVILLDEADQASPRILEDLRALTNFVHDDETIFRVVLIGSNDLEERLGTTELEAVNHRVVCQVSLVALTKGESADYLARRLEIAGVDAEELMTPVAIEEISEIAGGVPRAINMLAAKAIEKLDAADDDPGPGGDVHNDAAASSDEIDWDEEAGGESGRVTRSIVLAALDDLESLPIAWRRPLATPDESFWNEKRRSDELPALEPLSGAVLEVGGCSSDVIPDEEIPALAASQGNNDPESSDQVESEAGIEPLRAGERTPSISSVEEKGVDAAAESTVAGSLPSPLLRMQEVLGDDAGGPDDRLAQIAASILQGVKPSGDVIPANEGVAGRVDDEQVADPSTLEDAVADESSGSHDVHGSIAVNPSLDDTAFRDTLDTDSDVSDREVLEVESTAESKGGDQESGVIEAVGEFAEPFPAPVDELGEPLSDEPDSSLIEQIPIDAAESNGDVEPTDAENGASANEGEHDGGDASTTLRRDRGKSATDFVEAVLPLVGTNDPEATSVTQLEDMLDAVDSSREDGPQSDESDVGRDALNLAAEVRGLLERDEDRALSGGSTDSSRTSRSDIPSFAFDEPQPAGGTSGGPEPTEIIAAPANEVGHMTRQEIDHDAAAGTPTVNAGSDTERAVPAGNEFERAIRKPRRLEGLFTRLRQSRSST